MIRPARVQRRPRGRIVLARPRVGVRRPRSVSDDAAVVGTRWEGADPRMAISEVVLRRRWSDGQPCHGLWNMLPGAVTGEVLARTGADFVVTDLQHGATAEAELPGVTAAITAAG